MSSMAAVLVFVVTILLAILIHELGHLLAAKAFGMRADRYFAGFGPTLWSTRRGETEYGLKALPLGGFVAIRGMSPLDERRAPVVDAVLASLPERAGEGPGVPAALLDQLTATLDERGVPAAATARIRERARDELAAPVADGELAEARARLTGVLEAELGAPRRTGDVAWRVLRGDEGRFYEDRPAWQRALSVFAGPATHLVVAFALLFAGYLAVPLPGDELTTEVGAVLEGSPAAEAGLEAGDRVVGVQGRESEDFFVLRDVIRDRAGEPTTLSVQREGRRLEVTLTPRADTDPETGETVGVAGYVPMPVTERVGPTAAFTGALTGSEVQPLGGVGPMLDASVRGLVSVFSPSGLGDLVSTSVGAQERDQDGVVSVIGIANVAGQTAQAGPAGVFSLLFLLAYVNTFLFIFNLVPLPPFDGGHLAVVGVEKVGNLTRRLRGRPQTFKVDPRAITAVAVPVIGVLLLVLVTTVWLDISDPLQLG